MAIHVGRWDCTSCGYKGVLGPKTECPNCGADRPKNVRFYMAAEEDIVQDPTLLSQARGGADWRCSYCGQNNKNTETICKDCGNPRGKADQQLVIRDYKAHEVPFSGKTTKHSSQPAPEEVAPPAFNKKGCFILLTLLVALMVALSWSKDIYVTVEHFEWTRTIQVEEHKKVREEDWSLPNRAELISSSREIHHYDQVLDHYETRTRTQQRAVGTEEYVCGKRDLGNGYFEDKYCTRTIYEDYQEEYEAPVYRDEPVYQTKYQYYIYRWLISTPIVTTGNNHEPQWGDTYAIKHQSNLRESGRSAEYKIIVQDEKSEQHDHVVPFEVWERLTIGEQLKAKRGSMTGRYRGLDEEALKN